jgi:phage terminase Nu1 subunit (DNA packaging protein)
LKLLDVQTRLREVELAEKEGTLISKAAVEQEWFRIAREIRDNLTNIASRIAGLVAVEKNQEACYQIVDKEMRQALERLAS